MQWMILFLLASEPLPKDLAYQMDQIRLLPAPISGGMMVEMARASKLSAVHKRELAEEAFEIAMRPAHRELKVYSGGGTRLSVDTLKGVEELWWANPSAVAGAAFALYQANSGAAIVPPERKMSERFPERGSGTRSSCETFLVSDPKGYFEFARQVGVKDFQNSLGGVRSSVDLGRALEALPQATVAEREGYAGFVSERLMSLQDSDREFSYALRLTPLHSAVLRLAAGSSGGAKSRLLASYRGFLQRHFEGERCPDQVDETWEGVVREFNQALAGTGLAPLGKSAGLAQRFAPKSKEEFLFEGPIASALWLDSGNLKGEETEFVNFLRRMDEWKADEYAGAAGGIAKLELYRRALARVKEPGQADRLFAAYSKFLGAGVLRNELPTYWLAGEESLSAWARQGRKQGDTMELLGDAGSKAFFKAKLYLQGLKGK